jgi:hypothetical protein
MGLFGKTNVKRMYNWSNFIGLIKALEHSDSSISRDADDALRKLVDDTDKKIYRKENWLIADYNGILDWIEKKDQTKYEVVEHLVRVFSEEKETPSPILRLERYFKSFGGLSTNDNTKKAFIKEVNSILDEDEWFEIARRLPGKHYASSCGGLLATNKRVLYFNIGVAYKLMNQRYDTIKSFKYDTKKKVLKIKGEDAWIEYPIGEDKKLKKVASFIEARVSGHEK